MKKDNDALSLESEVIAKLKDDINAVLQSTLFNMESKESETAGITINIGIELTSEHIRDERIPEYYAEREIIVPKFTHNITSSINIKSKKKGTSGGEGYELVWNKETNSYRITETGDKQLTIDDTAREKEGSEEETA